MKRSSSIFGVLVLFVYTVTPFVAIAAAKTLNEVRFVELEDVIPAKNFTLDDIEDRQVGLKNFRGKVVLLFFWTTW